MTSYNPLDEPLRLHADDLFNRWPFSQRLADTIAGLDSSGGAPIIGLFGKWGYGKSTVLNFVCEALEDKHKEKIIVFQFNPWLFKDPETLLLSFFSGLAEKVQASLTSKGKNAAAFIAKYAGALAAIPVVGAGMANAAKALGDDFAANPIGAQRAQLIELMRESGRTIVVLIDDLDRLDRNEIMTMLKLVRLSANFPHVVYLLAFDEERVARVAGEAYGEAGDGRQFLEKIIQFPLSLPAVGQRRLAEFVLNQAKSACAAAGIELTEKRWRAFTDVCSGSLMIRLTTPRQAIRYANAMRFALPMLAGEVDPYSQMLVEAMRILFPELYLWARERSQLDGRNLEEAYDEVRQMIGKSGKEDAKAAERLLRELTGDNCDRKKPVFSFDSARYHGRYFSYAVAADDIPDSEMGKIVRLASEDKQALDKAIIRLAAKLPEVLVERLAALSQEGLSTNQAARIIIALAGIGTFLSGQPSFKGNVVLDKVGELIGKWLIELPTTHDTRRSIVFKAMEKAQPTPVAIVLFNEICRQHAIAGHVQDVAASEDDLSDEDLLAVGRAIATRIANEAETAPPYKVFDPADAFQVMSHWNRFYPADERQWLSQRLQMFAAEAVTVLRLFPERMVNYQFICDLVEPTVIQKALHSHFKGDLTNPSSRSEGLGEALSFLDAHRWHLNKRAGTKVGG